MDKSLNKTRKAQVWEKSMKTGVRGQTNGEGVCRLVCGVKYGRGYMRTGMRARNMKRIGEDR